MSSIFVPIFYIVGSCSKIVILIFSPQKGGRFGGGGGTGNDGRNSILYSPVYILLNESSLQDTYLLLIFSSSFLVF